MYMYIYILYIYTCLLMCPQVFICLVVFSCCCPVFILCFSHVLPAFILAWPGASSSWAKVHLMFTRGRRRKKKRKRKRERERKRKRKRKRKRERERERKREREKEEREGERESIIGDSTRWETCCKVGEERICCPDIKDIKLTVLSSLWVLKQAIFNLHLWIRQKPKTGFQSLDFCSFQFSDTLR